MPHWLEIEYIFFTFENVMKEGWTIVKNKTDVTIPKFGDNTVYYQIWLYQWIDRLQWDEYVHIGELLR